MQDLPTLTIAIATIGDRLHGIDLPEPMAGVDYLITCQNGAGIQPLSFDSRMDVQVVHVASTGLSRNRNEGLARAEGELVLFSDDDIRLEPEGLCAVRKAFGNAPELALVLGWRAGRLRCDSRHSRVYPLSRFNSGRACAPEFTVRSAMVRAQAIRFDEEFGVGARYPIGEDYIFVSDILKAGLSGQSLPVVVGRHSGQSSGANWHDPKVMQARRQMISRVFGRWAFPMRLAYAMKHARRFESVAVFRAFVF